MAKEVPIVRSRTIAGIEAIADDILRRYSPGTLAGKTPFSVLEFIDGPLQDDYHLGFAVEDLGPYKEGRLRDGTLTLNTRVYQGLIKHQNRDRFTGSHEIGHAIMHADELEAINDGSRGRPTLFRREDVKPWLDPEWQADTFAGAVLMPISGVLARLGSSAWTSKQGAVHALTTTFVVSQQAAEIRLRKLMDRGVVTL